MSENVGYLHSSPLIPQRLSSGGPGCILLAPRPGSSSGSGPPPTRQGCLNLLVGNEADGQRRFGGFQNGRQHEGLCGSVPRG